MKHIPEDLVRYYIALDKQLAEVSAEHSKLKAKLRKYHARGFASELLTFRDSSRQNIPWKTLTTQLCRRFMTATQKRMYFRNLLKRFPREPIETSVVIKEKEKSAAIR